MAAGHKLLTAKKHAWVKARRNPTVKGHALNPNAGTTARYNRTLQKLVRTMTKEVEREITALFKSPTGAAYFAQDASISSQAKILLNKLSDRFELMFGRAAAPAANAMVTNAAAASASALGSSLTQLSGGLAIKTDILSGSLSEIVKSTVTTNVNLIKSIPTKYLDDVNHAVMNSITNGNGLQDLVPFFEKKGKMTEDRAKLIAEDQTRKVFNGINAGRMQKVGVDEYEWLHSGGSQHPREDHIELNGKICSLKNPPVIDSKTGIRGKPGDLTNCKCRMRPIIRFNEEPAENGDDTEN